MSRVFICYSRNSKEAVSTLADDVKALGYDAWFDQELRGGQAWWDEILGNIRDTDLFMIALAPDTLNSVACKSEYGYAADLGKSIIPILVADGVSTRLLPPTLSVIQFVDYRVQDRDAALRLARALSAAPPPQSLPDPLPTPPRAPISYLGSLLEKIEGTSTLRYNEQSALLLDLKRSLRDPSTADDARELLVRLSKRRDLLATIANEIDEILRRGAGASSSSASLVDYSEDRQAPTLRELLTVLYMPRLRERLIGALVGAVVGTILGVFAESTSGDGKPGNGLLLAAGAAIAGAISGTHTRVIVLAVLGAVMGFWIAFNEYVGSNYAIAAGGLFGAPIGAVVGAAFGSLLNLYKKNRS